MMTFTARYPGQCLMCFDAIEPGDEVTYVDDELMHDLCAPDTEGGLW